MAIGKTTFGIGFPFTDSSRGDYVKLTTSASEQIKSDLVHLLLTRKGTRYFMPDFGTNLYQYLFENIDEVVIGKIENEIIDSCATYLPSVKINKVTIKDYLNDTAYVDNDEIQHKLTINIDYDVQSKSFSERNSITLNL